MYALLTLRKNGSSISVLLPKEQAERFKLVPGGRIFAIETERGILLTPFDPSLEQAMDVYRRGATKYSNALQELGQAPGA